VRIGVYQEWKEKESLRKMEEVAVDDAALVNIASTASATSA
jgi:hypothetical protein